MTVTRSTAALTMLLGLGAATAALTGSQAQATATTTTSVTATAAAYTKYVVISPQPVEIWIDSEPNAFNETWYKLSLGQVFCANGTNASNTRFKVDYFCHPTQQCDPVGPHTGWVTNSPLRVIQLNCMARTLTRSATVFTVPENDEAWMDWPSGTSFCAYGSNATATRFQVFVYCGAPACARPEGGYVGWVTSDPSYYAAAPPAVPSNMSATTPAATSIRLQWTDNSSDEDGFEVINGVTSRRVGANITTYTWDVAAGTYMCFKIRAYNASGYSNYHPSALLEQHFTADKMLGPRQLLGPVLAQIDVLDGLRKHARPGTTEPALRLLSQYAEFAGWLHQDAGDTSAAMYWSDRASQWAQAVGDYQMVAYMLVRKSNIALLDDDADTVIELAAAARKVPGSVSPKLTALAAQQEARGWALHGDDTRFQESLDLAANLLHDHPNDVEEAAPVYLHHYDLGTLEEQSASGYRACGQAETALAILERKVASTPEHLQRDQGHQIAKLANTVLATSQPDPERAADLGLRCVATARQTGSARIAKELRALVTGDPLLV